MYGEAIRDPPEAARRVVAFFATFRTPMEAARALYAANTVCDHHVETRREWRCRWVTATSRAARASSALQGLP